MTTADLREELGARPDPEFQLELPPGWSRREPDDATREEMLAALKRRLMEAHRPDLFAQTKLMLEESFEQMRRHRVFAFFAPTDPDPGTLFAPASLNASYRTAGPGENLDTVVRTLVREHGARPLMGDKRTLRTERTKQVKVGSDTLVNHSVLYLTPVPGTERRRALQLVAGFGRTPDTPEDDTRMQAMRLLFDSCVATLRWQVPAG